MAMHPLPFGHAEWPEEPIGTHDPRDFGEPARDRRFRVAVSDTLEQRVEASAALEGAPPEIWIVGALSRSVDPRLPEVS
jgi:hypothetical protein